MKDCSISATRKYLSSATQPAPCQCKDMKAFLLGPKAHSRDKSDLNCLKKEVRVDGDKIVSDGGREE